MASGLAPFGGHEAQRRAAKRKLAVRPERGLYKAKKLLVTILLMNLEVYSVRFIVLFSDSLHKYFSAGKLGNSTRFRHFLSHFCLLPLFLTYSLTHLLSIVLTSLL